MINNKNRIQVHMTNIIGGRYMLCCLVCVFLIRKLLEAYVQYKYRVVIQDCSGIPWCGVEW